ncbi:hypothetical protein ES703_98891 [subsurface metagenome]
MNNSVKALLLGFLILTLSFPAFSEITVAFEDQNYQVKIEKGVAASMRDGVKLYATIYCPDAPGRFPVTLIRIPMKFKIAPGCP